MHRIFHKIKYGTLHKIFKNNIIVDCMTINSLTKTSLLSIVLEYLTTSAEKAFNICYFGLLASDPSPKPYWVTSMGRLLQGTPY